MVGKMPVEVKLADLVPQRKAKQEGSRKPRTPQQSRPPTQSSPGRAGFLRRAHYLQWIYFVEIPTSTTLWQHILKRDLIC